MPYLNTTPNHGDTDTVLLTKIAQSLGVQIALGDTPNELLASIASIVAGLGGAGADAYVLKAGDTMTGSLNIGDIDLGDNFDFQFLTTGNPHIRRKTADLNGATLSFDKRGTTGDDTAPVVLNNFLGAFIAAGWDGAAFGDAASIVFSAKETFTGSAHGGEIRFSTTTPGTAAGTAERVRIDNTGMDLQNGTPITIGGIEITNPVEAHGAGTAYTLTNVSARVNFGTTDADITLSALGTYVVRARVMVELVGATFAANQTLTLKLRRTNFTATDLANTTTTWTVPIVTTETRTLAVINLPETFYVSANVGEIVRIYADLDVLPSAGSVTITEATVLATRLHE